MDRLYKIGIRKSNGDVISAPGRDLAAETTPGPSLKVKKSRISLGKR
jgi:hypothetical protein